VPPRVGRHPCFLAEIAGELATAYASQGRLDEAFAALEREGARLGGALQLRLDAERTLLLNWVRDSTLPPWRDELFARLAGETPEERCALVRAALDQAFDQPGRAELALRALGDGALTDEFPVDGVAGAQSVYVIGTAEQCERVERELAIAQARFVTEKTVETHLHRVFRKRDISARRDLPPESVTGDKLQAA
jgi:hypothetical protein